MNDQANTVVTTRADMERQWAEQRRPNFVRAHPERQGGAARFDSGVGMVSRAVTARYPHPANSTVGDYPSMKEVSYRRLPDSVEVNDQLALHSHVAWGHPPWRTEVRRGALGR